MNLFDPENRDYDVVCGCGRVYDLREVPACPDCYPQFTARTVALKPEESWNQPPEIYEDGGSH